MAKVDPQALCERLFTTFLAPLVLGGTMLPGKPFGGKNAFSIGENRQPADSDMLSRTNLARVRVARKIAPVDTFEPIPTAEEWILAAMLHDIVQSTHPGFDAVFRRSGPARILEVVFATLERVPAPKNVAEALSRHTWLSRMFELTRTDIDLRWWTGSQTFLGEDPPARLLAWPEVRRVQETRTPRPLMDLPTSGASVDGQRFENAVSALLQKTPLTDLATINRSSPPFAWTHETLSLVSTHAGRTLAQRAFALLPQPAVDTRLGAATRRLFEAKARRAAFVAMDLLRDRALTLATLRLTKTAASAQPEPLALGPTPDDAAFALSAGAIAATHWIGQTGGGLAERERRAILEILAPAARSAAAGQLQALLAS